VVVKAGGWARAPVTKSVPGGGVVAALVVETPERSTRNKGTGKVGDTQAA
jgi:hypothetical protein